MGTRTNFYKNPSISYKKDLGLSSILQNLSAYNVATGIAPESEEHTPKGDEKAAQKRRREPKPTPSRSRGIEENDGPMSHQDYINKRRKEVGSAPAYEELTEDVLETSCSGTGLVQYESDESSSECEEKQDAPNSGNINGFDQVKDKSGKRSPVPGEPICVICGKYGEYICDETDDDICSMECKAELLEILKNSECPLNNLNPVVSSSELKCALKVPYFGEDDWDYNRHRWSKKTSSLCNYKCLQHNTNTPCERLAREQFWKCQKPGHLAEDCLVTAINSQSPCSSRTCNEVAAGPNKSISISRDLLGLYRRCHQIGRDSLTARCNACHSSLSLATCLDCSIVLCDNAGHLNEHIQKHPSHRQFYSHKLKRLVKCCKSTCEMSDIKDLLVCHYCFNKAFDKFYDMYTATWKRAGLSIVWGSICCEDHFTWHRMNCSSADTEDSAYIISRNARRDKLVQLSDFIF